MLLTWYVRSTRATTLGVGLYNIQRAPKLSDALSLRHTVST